MNAFARIQKVCAIVGCCLWILIIGSPAVKAQPNMDSLIHLTQWLEADGGNGHWYAVLPGKRYWEDAHALAATFEHEGHTAYLATVTTPDENQFILNHVIAGTNQPVSGNAVLDEFWLDGLFVDGRWAWLTGEPMVYTNWSTGEPNNLGIETALGMWGPNQTDYRRIPGKWNNALPDASVNPYSVFWSIIEWGDFDTTSYLPPDTLINLIQWPAGSGGNDHWYAVLARELYWYEASALAPSFDRNGEQGYLATVASAAENQFILQYVLGDTHQPSILDLFWLDGREIGGTWRWLTMEPFVYTNWATGEPNNVGIETALSMAGPNVTNPLSPPGTWINALPDDHVNTLHRWWSVVEWGAPDSTVPPDTTLPPDTIVNLIKWPSADGGNDHWYAVMPGEHYWVDAQRMAVALELDGESGYLATVTTPAENDFILNHVIVGTHQPSVLDMFWMGGRDIAGWRWITGEPFVYINWSTGEPNNQGIETALGMWGYHQTDPRRIPGKWNNALPDPTVNPLARFWSLVEWGGLDSTISPPVCGNGILEIGEDCDDGNDISGDGCGRHCQVENPAAIEVSFTTDLGNDTLYVGMPGSIVFSVSAPVDQRIAAMAFPMIYSFTNGNVIGPVTEGGPGATVVFSDKARDTFESLSWNLERGLAATDPDTTVAGLVDFGGSIWSGSGEVWRIDFVPLDTGTIVIDQGAVPPLTGLELVDPMAATLSFGWQSKSIVVLPSIPTGDVDGSASITSADVVFLVNFVFKGGAVPLPCEAKADVNCSGSVGAADIIRLIGYIFKSGGEPCNSGALAEAGLWDCP
jgi:cysteine-rich repeat protein